MEGNITKKKFEQWLRNPVNYKQIENIANAAYKKMDAKYVSLPGMKSSADDICQELFTFILEKPGILKDLLHGTLNNLFNNFWRHIIDKIRSKENNQDIYKNTWRLFRRHVLSILNSSKLKKNKAPGKEISFGLSDNATITIVLPEDLDLSYPDDIPSNYEQLKKKKNILKLTDYFWRGMAEKNNDPNFRVSVSTFIIWIGKYVDLQTNVDSEADFSLSENSEEKKGIEFKLNQRTMSTTEIEKISDVIIPDSIKQWSKNFYNSLNEIEKEVFLYYECQALKGREISKIMGKKASLSYQKNKIQDKLREFLRPLRWLSPPDWKEDAFNFFMDELCEKLSLKITGDKRY